MAKIYKETFEGVIPRSNYDGDTIRFDLPSIPSEILGVDVPVRLYGVQAPERKTKNPYEKKLAYIAKKFVEKKLKEAKDIRLTHPRRGTFRPIVARVLCDGEDLSKSLLKMGLAVPYYGEKKPRVKWKEMFQRYLKSLKG